MLFAFVSVAEDTADIVALLLLLIPHRESRQTTKPNGDERLDKMRERERKESGLLFRRGWLRL